MAAAKWKQKCTDLKSELMQSGSNGLFTASTKTCLVVKHILMRNGKRVHKQKYTNNYIIILLFKKGPAQQNVQVPGMNRKKLGTHNHLYRLTKTRNATLQK